MVVYCFRLSFKASPFYTVIRLASQLVAAAVTILTAFLSKYVIDLLGGAAQTDDPGLLLALLLLATLFLGVLSILFQKLGDYAANMHNDILSTRITLEMQDVAVKADLAFFDNPKYYDAFENVKRDTYAVVGVVWNVIDGLSAVVTAASAFGLLCRVNVWFALLILAATLPATVIDQKYTKLLYMWDLDHVAEQRRMGYLNYVLTERAYAPDIRLFGIGGLLRDRYRRTWRAYFEQRKNISRRRTAVSAALSCLPELCAAFVLFRLSFGVLDGRNTVGDYTLYSGLLAQLTASMFVAVGAAMRIYEDKLRIQNVRSFDRFRNTVCDTGKHTLSGEVEIEFRNVSFRYPGAEAPVLRSVSFRVRKGEKVCIVGVNGAGKSTLIKLLLRFYDVDEGSILLNGRDIREYTLASVRRCFSSFFQQFVNFAFTLRENIILSDYESYRGDDAPVLRAMEESELSDLLGELPRGLDTFISKHFEEDGAELSGGQQQKLALARTFYRQSAVIILDEPSAALDPEAEYRVFRTLGRLCGGKSALFTSHRLSNVFLADRIVVLEEGVVVEQGTHAELMGKNGRYAELYRYQADKFTQSEA